jgi:hypothetical protein
MAAPGAIVCFGEILLRLSAPRGELVLQTPMFQVAVGGAAANVAVALARADAPSAMVSILPDNALGSATGCVRHSPLSRSESKADLVDERRDLSFRNPVNSVRRNEPDAWGRRDCTKRLDALALWGSGVTDSCDRNNSSPI